MSIAVHRILCHAEEDKDGYRGKNGDVADVHVRKAKVVGGQEDDGVPGKREAAVMNGIVVERLQRS